MYDRAVARPVDHGPRHIWLEPTARAARDARGFVAEALAEFGHADLVEDATLIASELVTNSITHTPKHPIWVGIWRTGAFLDLEVWDCSTEPPVYLDPNYLAEGGRGLHIVQQLGAACGYTIFDHGKVVWAILKFTSPRLPGISWVD
ncbi:MAG TPA: ATP-binding protein [Streptosporangiaceae bacterium]|nr:ATP-binding protein [Streptosporangiaceae bacterium]